jgi:hypothetical protein
VQHIRKETQKFERRLLDKYQSLKIQLKQSIRSPMNSYWSENLKNSPMILDDFDFFYFNQLSAESTSNQIQSLFSQLELLFPDSVNGRVIHTFRLPSSTMCSCGMIRRIITHFPPKVGRLGSQTVH